MSGAWRHDLIPVLSLTGVILDALGGMYLAYDLLGGKRGPLRTITKSVSYGVMFGTIYAIPLGVWFGLAGLLVSGPALSLEIGRREHSRNLSHNEAVAFALLRAGSFGAAGWLAKDPWFGVCFGALSAIGLVTTYLTIGPTPLDRSRIDKVVLQRAVFRGASIGLAAILAGAINKEPHTLIYGVEVGLVTGISSGLLVAVAPAVEAWVDNLPDRRLGGFGAILVLIGSLLQTAQYLFPLVGLSTR
jgi:hypothetical protein